MPLSRRERAVHFRLAAIFLALAVPLALLAPGREAALGPALALLLALAVASRVEFDVGSGYTVPTQLFFVPMLFALPVGVVPLWVALGYAVAKSPEVLRGRMHWDRLLLALTDSFYALGPALVLALAGAPAADWGDWPLYLAALATQFAVGLGVSATTQRILFGASQIRRLRGIGSVYLADAALSPAGLAIAFVYSDYAFLLALPLVGLLSLVAAERRVRVAHAQALSHAYRVTAMLLAEVVENDDTYTGEHSRGVLTLSLEVADAMGMSEREQRMVEITALLHDVGKLVIPNEIINKAGELTQEEMALVRTHTVEGHRILETVGGTLGEVGKVVRACHERWDGGGYPDGLRGDEIPLAARIIFCCDAYNAMTTTRSYRAALPHRAAIEELRANAGAQFDPKIAAVLVGLLERTDGVRTTPAGAGLSPAAAV